MSSPEPPTRAFPAVLIGLGSAAILGTLAADALGIGGSPGFGWKEGLAVAAGAALLLAGLLLPAASRSALARRVAAAAPIRPGSCVLLAMWFGLLTGFFEAGHAALRKRLSERVLTSADESVWLIPACYFAYFLVLGVLLAGAARAWPRLVTFPVVLFAYTVFACWTQFLVHPWLDSVAVMVAAAGLGWQVARVGSRREAGLRRLCRRTTPWMAGAVVVIALGMPVVEDLVEQRTNAGLPAPRAGAPNVLLIVLDTVRADHLSLYGYHRETSPALDALGASGVVFDWAFSNSSWTVPSHAALFTGRYEHEFMPTGYMEVLDDRFPTLAETFTARGYATAGFVGNITRCCADRGFARGFTHYEDYYVTPEVALLATSLGQLLVGEGPHRPRVRNGAGTITTQFLRWLEDKGDRPFFAFLNYFDAHALYLPPPGYDTLFPPVSEKLYEWTSQARHFTAEDIAGFERAYDGCIRFIDDKIREILDRLRATGELDDTLIVVVGDHGEHFHEHGLLSHANSLYSPNVHVPLLIAYPAAIREPRRIAPMVSLRDVASTILELSGAQPVAPFPGQSLSRLWAGASDNGHGLPDLSPVLSDLRPAGSAESKPSWWPLSRGEMKSLARDGMHFILNGDGTAELYDLRTDPTGLRNVLDTDLGKRLEPRFREELARILAK